METKKLVTAEGTIVYYLNINGVNKLHNIDGPALIPNGNKRASEYYGKFIDQITDVKSCKYNIIYYIAVMAPYNEQELEF